MTESGEMPNVFYLDAIRNQENYKEDQFREEFLAKNLFHDAHLEAVASTWSERADGIELQKAYLKSLKEQFLVDKRNINMGDRFNLAISEKYVGKISVIELGKTTNPDINGDVDSLRGEYNDFVSWLKEQPNIRLKEFTRTESGRDISVRHPVDPEVCDISIAVRNRPLVEAYISERDYTLRIGIAKRMVFMVDTMKIVPLMRRDNLTSEHTIGMVESWLEQGIGPDKPIRGAVRTAYYLATDIKSNT